MVSGIGDIVDPLPQALMLTMIVINLCLTALALTIVVWLYNEFGTLDMGEMK
jgi:multicomponent Na+:H+ antiporter subunit C